MLDYILHGLYAARIAIAFNSCIYVVHFAHLSWFHKHMTACMYVELRPPTGICQKIRLYLQSILSQQPLGAFGTYAQIQVKRMAGIKRWEGGGGGGGGGGR